MAHAPAVDRDATRSSRDPAPAAAAAVPAARRLTAAAGLLLWPLALAALLAGVASTPLMDPDEGRNAEVAREMAESGDFVVPQLNGLPYLDKPVLFFAAGAAAMRALGTTELAARLPSLLATLATLALVATFGAHRHGRAHGGLAALAFATCPLVVCFARLAIFDALLSLWVTAACLTFWLGWERKGAGWWVAGWCAAGLATLTKGPVGIAFPLAVCLVYAVLARRPLRRLFHPAGVVAYVLLVAPWLFGVYARHPDFFHYALVRETFERMTTERMNRTEPFWYFVPLLLAGALPWSLLPIAGVGRVAAVWRARADTAREEVLLWVWIVLPFVLFSLGQSKRPGYILPLFPAVALLAARIFLSDPEARRRAGVGTLALTAGGGVVLLLGSGVIAGLLSKTPGIAAALRDVGPWVGGALLALAAAVGTAVARGAGAGWLSAFALPTVVLALGLQGVIAALGEHRSTRTLAAGIRNATPPASRVVGVGAYPPSLPFYLDSRVMLSTVHGVELTSNYIKDNVARLRDVPDSSLRPPRWWRSEMENCRTPTVFVVRAEAAVKRAALSERLPLLVETPRYAAYGPCGGEG